MSENEKKSQLLVETWIKVRLELDKSLLLISTGGLGVITAFLSAFSEMFYSAYIAAFFFILTITGTIIIFKGNSSLLEKINDGKETIKIEKTLKILDNLVLFSAATGIIFAVMFIYIGLKYNSNGELRCQTIQINLVK